jgi:ABC-2 type transport system permease protein
VTPARVLRLVAVLWWLQLKMMNRSAFDGLLQLVWPLFFVTTALLVYRAAGDPQALVAAALGASVMTVWTALSSSASAILRRERGFGTLELLVAAPVPFPLTVLAIVLAVTTVGSYAFVATLLWARLVFGVPVDPARPALFAVAVAVAVLAFAVLGFILSVTVVRYRAAWSLAGALEVPVWLLCGFLVPVGLLPDWMRTLSWLLPPTWGMAAVRAAAAGRVVWPELAACLASSAVGLLVGIRLTGTVLRSVRRHGTLALS